MVFITVTEQKTTYSKYYKKTVGALTKQMKIAIVITIVSIKTHMTVNSLDMITHICIRPVEV